jgi:uncharacterized protein (DUF342 family)
MNAVHYRIYHMFNDWPRALSGESPIFSLCRLGDPLCVGNDRIHIQISEDGLEAHASVEVGPKATLEDLRAALAAAGVVHGIDDLACQELGGKLADEAFEAQCEFVARGIPPERGEDGSLSLEFTPGAQPGKKREDGSIDLFDRELLTIVEEGERLAVRHPPGEGSVGTSVDGKAIVAADGSPEPTQLGKGATEDSGGVITATRGGVIQFQSGRLLDAVSHHVHAGDVDVESGQLEMVGSLSVQGAVRPNLCVRVQGDVEVLGCVDAGCVYVRGDLRIGDGVIGGDAGRISAEGSAVVRHLQAARIECGGTLAVQSHAVNCEISAAEIQIGGRLLGGRASCETRMELCEAGSAAGAMTVLRAAEPLEQPLAATREVAPAAEVGRRSSQTAKSQAKESRSPSGGAVGSIKARREEERAAAKRSEERMRLHLELRETAEIRVSGAVHEGVVVHFGTHQLRVEQPTSHVRFCFDPDADAIVMESLG